LSDSFDLVVLIFAVDKEFDALSATEGRPVSAFIRPYYIDGLNAGQGAAVTFRVEPYVCVVQRQETGTPCKLLANGTTSAPA